MSTALLCVLHFPNSGTRITIGRNFDVPCCKYGRGSFAHFNVEIFERAELLGSGPCWPCEPWNLFFAGEEISWGQSYLQWTTPAWWQENFSGETNLHNSRLPVHQLSALFILGIFFLLPLKFRNYLNLPLALEPAIPEGPVISAIRHRIYFP